MSWDQIETKWMAMTRRVRAGGALSDVEIVNAPAAPTSKAPAVRVQRAFPSVLDQTEPTQ